MKNTRRVIALLVVTLAVAACARNPYVSLESKLTGRLSDATVRRHATGDDLAVDQATVITSNDDAFQSKLVMVENAQESIDAMYFIFADDYTSSVLAEALIAAAKRGVRVRLLLDYATNYKNLDLFSMMEKQGGGRLHVRFYNRPTRNIIMDAAFLTLGCDEANTQAGGKCGPAKQAAINHLFRDETIDGAAASDLNISNLNVAGSGLFLSGLYGKNPKATALAVMAGEDLDLAQVKQGGASATPEQKQNLLKVAKIYWRARTAPAFQRVYAQIQLAFAFALFGDDLNPVYDTVTQYLPLERRNFSDSARDWNYITDYLHHKLLLVDDKYVQLGGRNVEDSYHMRPNRLIEKYVFMDTDARLSLRSGGDAIASSFDGLWNFRAMVATIDEIRAHAPNEMVANGKALDEALTLCTSKNQMTVQEACLEREFRARARRLNEREAERLAKLTDNAAKYRAEYQPANDNAATPAFDVDPSALVVYGENLPFDNRAAAKVRHYGAVNGEEAESGKKIHGLWLAGLQNACRSATKERPKRVILHSAYFFPPSNLITRFARMINGDLNCANVTLTVLTNSIETTDLNVVNIFARHAAKAFAEYYEKEADPDRGARLEYYEYLKPVSGRTPSLHTKVSVFGDDIVVGSANADIRSYMMDSNNAVFIRNAPAFHDHYVRFVDGIMHDPSRSKNVTRYFMETDRDRMKNEDRQTFRAELKKYHADAKLTDEQIAKIEARIFRLLDTAYGLVRRILANPSDDKAQREFNQLFKGI